MASASSTPAQASSSVLWATPSKEWIIQPKPKPGRKPKKEATVPAKAEEDPESKGRRVQNRAAQRAFRERKQSQLAELQARVLSYEQGEIERNVALQNIAKRLKEENEKLRSENAFLRERLLKLEQDGSNQVIDKKRSRDTSPTSALSTRKRSRTLTAEASNPMTVSPLSAAYLPSPPSMVSSPDSNGSCETRFSPLPLEVPSADLNGDSSGMLNFSATKQNVTMANYEPAVFPQFDCGFCNEDTPCVCRELAMQQQADAERMNATNLKIEAAEQSRFIAPLEGTIRLDPSPAPTQLSILDNLPAYKPPVPLKRRAAKSFPGVIFPVIPASQNSRATCTGDPSNCSACSDDSFGQAFCAAVGKSSSLIAPCDNCPCGETSAAFGEAHSESHTCSHRTMASLPRPALSSYPIDEDTMPTNHAWKQLKAHPNVEFSDLELLADVVARRSKCTGPRVVISPAPGSITPERLPSPVPPPNNAAGADQQSVLLTDPHARYHEREHPRSPPPRLVPEEILIQCGRQRIREVSTNAVQHALRLLDAKYSRS